MVCKSKKITNIFEQSAVFSNTVEAIMQADEAARKTLESTKARAESANEIAAQKNSRTTVNCNKKEADIQINAVAEEFKKRLKSDTKRQQEKKACRHWKKLNRAYNNCRAGWISSAVNNIKL